MRSQNNFNRAESWSMNSLIIRRGKNQTGGFFSSFPNMEKEREGERKSAQMFLEINANHVTQNQF